MQRVKTGLGCRRRRLQQQRRQCRPCSRRRQASNFPPELERRLPKRSCGRKAPGVPASSLGRRAPAAGRRPAQRRRAALGAAAHALHTTALLAIRECGTGLLAASTLRPGDFVRRAGSHERLSAQVRAVPVHSSSSASAAPARAITAVGLLACPWRPSPECSVPGRRDAASRAPLLPQAGTAAAPPPLPPTSAPPAPLSPPQDQGQAAARGLGAD